MSNWSAKNVVILDSSRTLSESEVHSLFSNCGEILKLFPFSLPPKSLRDFPGLSHYFVEFSEADAANQAIKTYVPTDVKVDILIDTPELLALFTSLSESAESLVQSPRNKGQQGSQSSGKQSKLQVRVAVVRCPPEYDQTQVHSVFSTCGDVTNIYEWSSDKSRKRQYFVEFSRKEDVDRARRERFPVFDVLSLAQNMRWISKFKKCAKLGRWTLPKGS